MITKNQIVPAQYIYHNKGEYCSFWHQINEIISVNPRNVLEIGIGWGFTSSQLRKMGRYDVTTMDINPANNPDIVGDIRELPFPDNSFSVVAAFETLESLPYEEFIPTLKEMARVSTGTVVISLPDRTPYWKVMIKLGRRFYVERLIKLPWSKVKDPDESSIHYWDVSTPSVPLSRIKEDIKAVGLHLHKTYQPFEYTTKRFFVMKKLGH